MAQTKEKNTKCKKRRTHEEYIKEVSKINPDIEVIGKFINVRTKILHRCKKCGYGNNNEWSPMPGHILQGHGCPKCAMKIKSDKLDKNKNAYMEKLKKINPNVEMIGEYTRLDAVIKHKCTVCGHGNNGNWTPKPLNLLNGHGCPVCAGKRIGDAPEYKNSIWASDNRDYYSLYMTEEQMKKYTPNSGKMINMICPDCGKIKRIAPHTLNYAGLGCNCGGTQSYPNKFIYSMLNQLNVEYVPEYSPDWANKKRYDIYIPSLNCIIENHGKQHYVDQTGVFGELKDTQNNDAYKQNLALNNGIEYYIVLDCRYSNAGWIKNSICSSNLPSLLNFDLSDIDWDKCNKYAFKNLVKVASELWNEGLSVKEIYQRMSISHTAVLDYLQKGKSVGWCDYNGKEAHNRNHKIYVERAIKCHGKAVYCFELNKYYKSMAEAGVDIGSNSSGVKACCDGINHTVKGYHFCYIDKIKETEKKLKEIKDHNISERAHNEKPVRCIDTDIVYRSIRYASQQTKINSSYIGACCRGEQKTAGGYHWEFATENEN